jgi:hypothetical protein
MHPILTATIPPLEKLPAGLALDPLNSLLGGAETRCKTLMEGAFVIENLLQEQDVAELISIFRNAPKKEEVSALGLPKKEQDAYRGSERLSLWAPKLSEALYQLLLPWLSARSMNDFSRTDWWQHGKFRHWQPIGLSPLLRMMSYTKGAEHLPHYDAAYIYPDARYRSLMSVIFYLSTHSREAATRILADGQDLLPEWERKHADCFEPASEAQVLQRIYPQAGAVFIFDHRIFHDAERYEGDAERLLIRADLVFEGRG